MKTKCDDCIHKLICKYCDDFIQVNASVLHLNKSLPIEMPIGVSVKCGQYVNKPSAFMVGQR